MVNDPPPTLSVSVSVCLSSFTQPREAQAFSLSPSLSLSLSFLSPGLWRRGISPPLSLSLSLPLEHGQVAPVLARTRGWQVLAGFCLYTSLSLSLSLSFVLSHPHRNTDRPDDGQTNSHANVHTRTQTHQFKSLYRRVECHGGMQLRFTHFAELCRLSRNTWLAEPISRQRLFET